MSEKVQGNRDSQKLSTAAHFDTHLGPDYTMAARQVSLNNLF